MTIPGLLLGFPGFPDRPPRPQNLAKVTKVTKVTIPAEKVAYSQAGIVVPGPIPGFLGEIGAKRATFVTLILDSVTFTPFYATFARFWSFLGFLEAFWARFWSFLGFLGSIPDIPGLPGLPWPGFLLIPGLPGLPWARFRQKVPFCHFCSIPSERAVLSLLLDSWASLGLLAACSKPATREAPPPGYRHG